MSTWKYRSSVSTEPLFLMILIFGVTGISEHLPLVLLFFHGIFASLLTSLSVNIVEVDASGARPVSSDDKNCDSPWKSRFKCEHIDDYVS